MPSVPVVLAAVVAATTVLAACAQSQTPSPARSQAPAAEQAPAAPAAATGQAPSAAPGTAGDLSSCPARQPILRIGGVFTSEAFSPHPMEARFSSTSYTRLHQIPLFGADPKELKVDPAYGAAESWEFSDDARSLRVKLRSGMTFNNGDPVTAEDVVFSLELAESDFADLQLAGLIRAFGAKGEAINERELQINFKQGAVIFPTELSPLVYPLFVVSRKYHSDGAVTQQAFDSFRERPLASGPYEVVSRDVQKFIVLKAARKDPLLGCPLYERIEYRNIPETGTRVAQLQTGQLDIVEGNRDLIDQAKGFGANVVSKPAANLIGLYFFQTDVPGNIMGDARLRMAATYAIDHETLGKTIWKGVGVQRWGCTWPPPSEIATKEPAYMAACGAPYAYDPAKSRELLAQAGYGPNNRPRVRLIFWNNYPEEPDLAQAIQPMLNAVGFDAQIERIERAEFERRRMTDGVTNSIMFFGPGDRATALSGAYSVYGPSQGLGAKTDAELSGALDRAAGARTESEYTRAMADVAKIVKERPYGPGFFAAGSIWFLSSKISDWGLEQDRGRAPLNLAALVTRQ